MEQKFLSLRIHSKCLNYDLRDPRVQHMSRYIITKSHNARQSYELDKQAFIVAYEQSLSMVYDLKL